MIKVPTLSIIVPVYNKEQFLDDCIRSILGQSFIDYELILVNDGSTDGSGRICEYYAQSDSRIKLINQKNAGVSEARNVGISTANGKFIGFIDSDDSIEPDMYEILVNNAINTGADISVCRLRVIYPNKQVSPAEKQGAIILNPDEGLVACLNGSLDRSANNKIYKLATVSEINFEGHIYEDILYTCKAFIKSNRTVVENVSKYNYIIRDNSASMVAFNPAYLEMIDVSANMVNSCKSGDGLTAAMIFDVIANISLLNLILMAGKESYSEAYNRIAKNLSGYQSFINQTPLLDKKYKYAYRLFALSPLLYKKLMYIYCMINDAEVLKRTKRPRKR